MDYIGRTSQVVLAPAPSPVVSSFASFWKPFVVSPRVWIADDTQYSDLEIYSVFELLDKGHLLPSLEKKSAQRPEPLETSPLSNKTECPLSWLFPHRQ